MADSSAATTDRGGGSRRAAPDLALPAASPGAVLRPGRRRRAPAFCAGGCRSRPGKRAVSARGSGFSRRSRPAQMQRVRDGRAGRKTLSPLFSWRGVLSRTRGWDLAQGFAPPVARPGPPLCAREREQLEVVREVAQVLHERELVRVGLVVCRIALDAHALIIPANYIAKTTGQRERCSGPAPRRHRHWPHTAVWGQGATRAVRSTATSAGSVAALAPSSPRGPGVRGAARAPRRERSERGVDAARWRAHKRPVRAFVFCAKGRAHALPARRHRRTTYYMRAGFL